MATQFGVYSQLTARHHLRLLTVTISEQAASTYARDLYAQSPDFGKLFVIEGTTRIYIVPRDLPGFKVVSTAGEYVR
jgi:hypothetical protein